MKGKCISCMSHTVKQQQRWCVGSMGIAGVLAVVVGNRIALVDSTSMVVAVVAGCISWLLDVLFVCANRE